MKKIGLKRTAISVCLASAIAFAGSAGAAETWKMATKLPPESLDGQGFQKFADLVEEYTNGEIKIQVFPNEQLGKTEATLEQVGAGIVQIYAEGPDYLSKWAPELEYISAPFMFESRDHWLRFMSSDLVQGWLKRVEDEGGLTVIGHITEFPRGPYRVLAAKKQVETVADIQNLKLRMFPNDLVIDAYSHLGAEVRVLGWTEVYESLGRGIIESVTLPISLVEAMRFYEQGAKFVMQTDEFHQAAAFMVNAEAYRGLSPELREAVDRAVTDAAAFQSELLAGEVEKSIARLEAQGVKFMKADTVDFVNAMKDFYEKKRDVLPEGFIEAVEATR